MWWKAANNACVLRAIVAAAEHRSFFSNIIIDPALKARRSIDAYHSTKDNMKLSISAVSILALAGSTSAWSSTIRVSGARSLSAAALFGISAEQSGEAGTESFRLNFKNDEGTISPWHDIPLKGKKGYNMIVEIPKMTKAKMEIATKEASNPIAQDIKKGNLRDYHGPIFWNYGCLPQTWEDPNEEHPELKIFGDDDPIDVVEIGSKSLDMGSITEVKPLGVLAMIDDGELDWKVLAVAVDDPLAAEYNDIDDVPLAIQDGVREWFRWYKTPDDKPLNGFGFDEKFLNAAESEKVIEETHDAWKKLKAGDTEAGKLWLN
jgi:inorganic pyrophosphatase